MPPCLGRWFIASRAQHLCLAGLTMKISRHTYTRCALGLFLLFFSASDLFSQPTNGGSFLFLEVKDEAGKKIKGASVDILNLDKTGLNTISTDDAGTARNHFPLVSGAESYDIKISKSGYQPFEEIFTT